MKNLSKAALRCKNRGLTPPRLLRFLSRNGVSIFCSMALLITLLFASCKKQDLAKQDLNKKELTKPVNESLDLAMNSDEEFLTAYKKINESPDNKISASHEFSWITFWELLQARAATAKYRNFNKAIEDGYADINVVMPNMGYHYLKSAILDAKFEIRKPELLVYNKTHDGGMQLVALEYAVPIALSPNAPPDGFAGDHDVWKYDTAFQLWTLHAWVWRFNPDGVFNPTNPLVHVH